MWKVAYTYEYMNDWKKINETSLPENKDFYNHLNMEDITDSDHTHRKRVCKDFEIKNLGYHDLYIQSDALLISDIRELSEYVSWNIRTCSSFCCTTISMVSSLKDSKIQSEIRSFI